MGAAVWTVLGITLGSVVGYRSEKLFNSRARRAALLRIEASPVGLYDAVAVAFRAEIGARRQEMLGPTSDWQRARHPLREAGDEANGQVAYWRQRQQHEPKNRVASAQLDTALQLERKFRQALPDLDERSESLLGFFNKCEARISALERGKQDYVQSKRLASLGDRADLVIDEAGATLRRIGESFVGQAIRVGDALGSVERFHLKELAGEVPLDQMKAIADRIIETSVEEREALQNLTASVSA